MTKNTKILSAKDILGANDLPTEEVQTPEWGGTVIVKTMSAGERDEMELLSVNIDGKGKVAGFNRKDFRARLCAFTIVSEEGDLLFTEPQIKELSKKSSLVLNRIAEVAQRLNGMDEVTKEEMAEGFTDAQEGSSSSD